jgi:hypothetical protein
MNRLAIGRLVAVLAGAAVLFELQRGFGVQLYYAIPVAIVVYFAIKVAIGLMLGAGGKPT